MSKKTRNIIDCIKSSFNYDLYNDYLYGKIKRHTLCEKLNCTDYVLGNVLNELHLQTRCDFIDSNTKHTFFDEINSEEKAYILGLYLADGAISSDGIISFSQTEVDHELINIFRNAICPVCHISKQKERVNQQGYLSKPIYTVNILSRHICDVLNKYGIGVRKTYETDTDLKFIPDEYMMHFLRGYFDGDGTVCLVKGVTKKNTRYENVTWRITSYKKDHLCIIQKFLSDKFDIRSNVIKETKGEYILSVDSKQSFLKLRDILYKDASLYLNRKKEKMFGIEFELVPLSKKVKRTETKTGDYIIYDTLKNAGRDFGVSNTSIKNWIRLKKVVNDYKWEYV